MRAQEYAANDKNAKYAILGSVDWDSIPRALINI